MVKWNFKKLINFFCQRRTTNPPFLCSVDLVVSVFFVHCAPHIINYLVARTVWAYLLRTEHQEA